MALRRAAWRGFGHLGPRGPEDGPPALVIPGFIANDRTTMELAPRAGRGGWRVHPWGLGWNMGAQADTIERLKARLDAIDADEPVAAGRWSLGGVYARELARAEPERVRAVVTLGSPFSGDPSANQCLAAVRAGRRASGRRPAVPNVGQAAGADAGDLVALGRNRCPALRAGDRGDT